MTAYRWAGLLLAMITGACGSNESAPSGYAGNAGNAGSAGQLAAGSSAGGADGSGGAGQEGGAQSDGGVGQAGEGGEMGSGDVGGAGGGATTTVDCAAFAVSGDATAMQGATWTYESTDEGVAYSLEGIVFAPPGEGPFPGIVVNHGKGGTPSAYSANVAREFVDWGMIVIGAMLTHAPDDADAGHLPDGADGRSPENVQRAKKAYDLLSCLPVDMTRVAVHGHSMGGFVTGQLLGTHPELFRAASHTAGGTSPGPNATEAAVAAAIVTPYQLHHGDNDMVVLLEYDQDLAAVLEQSGTAHELHVYAGYDHAQMADDATMFQRVHDWYTAHGVLLP